MADAGLLYQNGKIEITKNVFSNGAGDKFIIANIKSIRDERTSKSFLPLIIGVIFLGLAAWREFFPDSRYVLAAIGGLFLFLYVRGKESYVIYIHNPQGEVAAFKTTEDSEFRDISRCLKKAISLHQ